MAPLMKQGIGTLLMYLYRVLGLTEEMKQVASSQNSCAVVCNFHCNVLWCFNT